MSVQDVANVSAGIDRARFLADRKTRHAEADVPPASYSIFRAGQLAATYQFVVWSELADLVDAVTDEISRRAGVATVTATKDTLLATSDTNPHTGRPWRPGERSTFAADHPGQRVVVDALVTTAADREGMCAWVVSPYVTHGADVEWLDPGIFNAEVYAGLEQSAQAHAEAMMAKAAPHLDPQGRATLESLGVSGKQAEEAERIIGDLEAANAMNNLLKGRLEGNSAVALTMFAAPGSVRHQVARGYFSKVPFVDPRKVPSAS